MSDNLFLEAFNYFRSVGYSAAQSAGIVGNLHGESSLNTKAVGDGGKAFGIAQWHPDRQALFKQQFGKDIRNSTFQEQLKFVHWELQNNEANAGKALKNTKSITDATNVFMTQYERPANNSSLNDRIKAAVKTYDMSMSNVANGKIPVFMKDVISKLPLPGLPGMNGQTVIDTMNGAKAVADETTSVFEKVINWIPRAVAIILGVCLIIIALAVLMGKGDTVIEVVKSSVE